MYLLSISDWVTGTAAFVMFFELKYLARRREEFRACWVFSAFNILLGALGVFFFASSVFHFTGETWLQPVRIVLMSVFSAAAALWLYTAIRRIIDLPRLDELEAQVSERTATLQSFIDCNPICAIQVSPAGLVTRWNPAAEELFGWKAEEVLGKPIPTIPEDRRAEFENIYRQTVSNTKLPPILTQRLHKSGALIDVCIWNAPLRTGKVREEGAMAMITDVSAQRLLSNQLETARVDAERSNAAKSRFLAQMSHEIRTPLTVILGFADLIAADNISPDQRQQYAGAIVRNGHALTTLIGDLLDLSKVEAGEMQIVKAPVLIRDLIADVKSCLALKASSKGIHVGTEISDRVPVEIEGDPLRIRQILYNLAGNSVKFTSSGEVVIRADYRNCELLLWVRDTGVGIPADQTNRLFKPFHQAHGGVAQNFGGTGLGLALSRELARLMGGDIALEHSQEFVGSEFLIRIPALTTSEGILSPLPEEPSLLTVPLRGLEILVADDADDNLALISHYLQEAGAQVTLVTNGEAALELTREQDFDVVLMDIQMPVCDGLKAMRELKARNYNRNVVALSAAAFPEEKQVCMKAGFSAYLTKPIQPDLLVKTLAKKAVIKRGNVRARSYTSNTPLPENPGAEDGRVHVHH